MLSFCETNLEVEHQLLSSQLLGNLLKLWWLKSLVFYENLVIGFSDNKVSKKFFLNVLQRFTKIMDHWIQ